MFAKISQNLFVLLMLPVTLEGAEPTYDDARNFVIARTESASISGKWGDTGTYVGSWSASDFELPRNGGWQWSESEQMTVSFSNGNRGGLVLTKRSYSVDPKLLTTEVTVDGKKVRIECAIPDCIKEATELFSIEWMPNSKDVHFDSKKNSGNTWHYDSNEEAQRVAKALRHLLALAGARRPAF